MRLMASQTSLSSVECTTSIPRSGANSSSSGGMTNASHSPGYRRSTSAIHSTLPRSTIAVYGQQQSQETPHSAEPHLPEALRPPCSAVVKLIITGMRGHQFYDIRGAPPGNPPGPCGDGSLLVLYQKPPPFSNGPAWRGA